MNHFVLPKDNCKNGNRLQSTVSPKTVAGGSNEFHGRHPKKFRREENLFPAISYTLHENEYFSVKWRYVEDTLKESRSSAEFKWKIENFSKLPKEVDIFYDSPEFNSPGYSWGLRLYPNGMSLNSSEGWIGLYVTKMDSECSILSGVNCIVGIENMNGAKKYLNGLYSIAFLRKRPVGWEHFLPLNELMQRKIEFYPSDNLTIWVWLQHDTPEFCRPQTEPIKVGNIKIGGPWKKTSEHIGMAMLSDDFKRLFLDEKDCDLTIKVKGKIFKTHKLVLKARSVFSLMLSLDTAERNDNVIEIYDCEAEAFDVFLLYLYTGKVEKLSDTNMLDVYYIANKYEIKDLKAECDSYIKCSMSVETISDIIYITRNHDDTELLNCALNYFMENVLEIIHTAGWKSFLGKEPNYGRKLYEKVIKRKKSLAAIKGK